MRSAYQGELTSTLNWTTKVDFFVFLHLDKRRKESRAAEKSVCHRDYEELTERERGRSEQVQNNARPILQSTPAARALIWRLPPKLLLTLRREREIKTNNQEWEREKKDKQESGRKPMASLSLWNSSEVSNDEKEKVYPSQSTPFVFLIKHSKKMNFNLKESANWNETY